jgi:hypothetical protein
MTFKDEQETKSKNRSNSRRKGVEYTYQKAAPKNAAPLKKKGK